MKTSGFNDATAFALAGLISIGALFSTPASPAWADEPQAAAAADLAIVTIPTPRAASLLKLRGYAGLGTAVIRYKGYCHSMDVRFVAGDFGGPGITAIRTGPIRIRITDSETVHMLFAGYDIVSDAIRAGSDFTITSGLSQSDAGFVINPGRNVLSEVFGPRPVRIPCRVLAAKERVAAEG